MSLRVLFFIGKVSKFHYEHDCITMSGNRTYQE